MSESDLERHARVLAELARGDRSREDILASHGLDEPSFAALDKRANTELSRAANDADGDVPASISSYGQAWAKATAALGPTSSSVSLERYAEATASIQRYGDPTVALAKVGLTLAEFLRATQHWTQRMMEEPDAVRRFTEILKQDAPPSVARPSAEPPEDVKRQS